MPEETLKCSLPELMKYLSGVNSSWKGCHSIWSTTTARGLVVGGHPKDSKSVLEFSGRNGMDQGIVWDSPNEGNFFPGLNVVNDGEGK